MTTQKPEDLERMKTYQRELELIATASFRHFLNGEDVKIKRPQQVFFPGVWSVGFENPAHLSHAINGVLIGERLGLKFGHDLLDFVSPVDVAYAEEPGITPWTPREYKIKDREYTPLREYIPRMLGKKYTHLSRPQWI